MFKRFRNDILLIAVLAMICLVSFLIIRGGRGTKDTDDAFLRIVSDNGTYGEYPLYEDKTVEVKNRYGELIVIIKDGECFVDKSSCPDRICVDTGRIKKAGQSIICLPNRVVCEIVSKKESEYDSVTY